MLQRELRGGAVARRSQVSVSGRIRNELRQARKGTKKTPNAASPSSRAACASEESFISRQKQLFVVPTFWFGLVFFRFTTLCRSTGPNPKFVRLGPLATAMLSHVWSGWLQELERRGAAEVPHLNKKTLIEHCVKVSSLLQDWGLPVRGDALSAKPRNI